MMRSLRFTRHMSMPVITMMTSVAEKISGVRNELYAACNQMPRPLRAPSYSAVAAVAKM